MMHEVQSMCALDSYQFLRDCIILLHDICNILFLYLYYLKLLENIIYSL